ncbi:S-adenosyl-methyltransferase MraW [Spiroplasma clarkii]|uniref:Ribosomal RNA small subunit methyltransferase H n=1 Tax=Spiroplasma clarkii TaxID=2139 RepID=A0A1Y0L0Z0_9MOLU|nr:16S rRNA (cytosine(1402)-N(4))-methyltransferase RsmH [Spiroplasma clarkii]ARU91405.1 S-adenosyl-methyltransferase MraW [Spiroplasma clarkii]ATX70821.1 S-adenosyl-methyltransferase MraW [Spiroplasma clarkii]
MTQKHVSVLLNEAIALLNIQAEGVYVDCTLGRAGHSVEILKQLTTGHLYAIDQDEEAIKASYTTLKKVGENFTILEGNFVDIKAMLAVNNVKQVNGILYDLGVSSPQFDEGNRGFSYRFDAPLDMRMDVNNNQMTAQIVVNTFSEKQLADIFYQYGDEKFSYQIAKNIIKVRTKQAITTTNELVEVIKQALPQKVLKQKKHPAKKTFQALRVYVNNELEVLKKSLNQALDLLLPGGRVVVITFQSHEERIVKELFKSKTTNSEDKFLAKLPIDNLIKAKEFALVHKKPISPNQAELENNRRSHSAKLWAIQKVV